MPPHAAAPGLSAEPAFLGFARRPMRLSPGSAALKPIFVDLKDRCLRVNAVSPGYADTPTWLSIEAAEEHMKTISNWIPLGRFAHPMRSPRPCCFSHPTTAATSRERNCLWMAASHKCTPLMAESLRR